MMKQRPQTRNILLKWVFPKAALYKMRCYTVPTIQEKIILIIQADKLKWQQMKPVWQQCLMYGLKMTRIKVLLAFYDQYIAGSTYEDNMNLFGKVSYDVLPES